MSRLLHWLLLYFVSTQQNRNHFRFFGQKSAPVMISFVCWQFFCVLARFFFTKNVFRVLLQNIFRSSRPFFFRFGLFEKKGDLTSSLSTSSSSSLSMWTEKIWIYPVCSYVLPNLPRFNADFCIDEMLFVSYDHLILCCNLVSLLEKISRCLKLLDQRRDKENVFTSLSMLLNTSFHEQAVFKDIQPTIN